MGKHPYCDEVHQRAIGVEKQEAEGLRISDTPHREAEIASLLYPLVLLVSSPLTLAIVGKYVHVAELKSCVFRSTWPVCVRALSSPIYKNELHNITRKGLVKIMSRPYYLVQLAADRECMSNVGSNFRLHSKECSFACK